jgi:two-component system alkaline phosphatase synthesis response regulator PhoP
MATVLVVDDEPDILLLHRLNLEAAGHEVVLAADGVTALERIEESRPDCVVLDVMMPVLDGWGVLEQLRETTSPPPVLVVSAKSSPADVAKAKELGAADFLAKPFDGEALLARVAGLVADSA